MFVAGNNVEGRHHVKFTPQWGYKKVGNSAIVHKTVNTTVT